EVAPQHLAGEEPVQIRWASLRTRPALLHLAGREGLQQHEPAWFHRQQGLGMNHRSNVRMEMEKEPSDDIELRIPPSPVLGRRHVCIDRHATLRGKTLCLLDPHYRWIERSYGEALLGKPNPVAPLAVAWKQSPLS